MSGFLLLLFKVNLAMGAAIVLVSPIRRILRAKFGAPIAYAIWLLVPIASVAVLLPPREISTPAYIAPVQAPAAPAPVTGYVPQSTFDAIEQMARHEVIMPFTPVKPLGSSHEIFDTSRLLFAAWVLGLLFMAAYLTRMQIRFSAAVRRGQAGPAVLGFFRPRIVMPDRFQEQFSAQEQAAILTHERVHLVRQDARINALVAFLRCFCWFNPLVHLGARWLRTDQELACDAIAVRGAISRRDYSMALLKSQVMVGVLPFGCNWPGPQHPLVERIALLQRKPPGSARRLAGAGLVVLAATSAGLGAWAAQPPIAAKAMAARQPAMARSTLAAAGAAQDQTVGNDGLGRPVAPANPTGSGSDVDISKDVRASRAVSEASVAEAMAATNSETTAVAQASASPPTDSFAAKPMPQEVSAPSAQEQATQPNESQGMAVESVIVTAPALRTEKALDNFIIAHSQPTQWLGKIARWKNGICPLAVGLSPKMNLYISQRIIRVAMMTGAPLDKGETCRPNILVIATGQPQAFLDFMSTKRPALLGAHYISQRPKIATMTLPVQAWYSTATEDFWGLITADLPSGELGYGVMSSGYVAGSANGIMAGQGAHVSGSRLRDGLKSELSTAVILVDTQKITGLQIGPLADYIAMLALSQGDSYDTCQDVPTINNLMAANCAAELKPAGLTDIDATYLRGLYKMDAGQSYRGERSSIVFEMKKELGGY